MIAEGPAKVRAGTQAKTLTAASDKRYLLGVHIEPAREPAAQCLVDTWSGFEGIRNPLR